MVVLALVAAACGSSSSRPSAPPPPAGRATIGGTVRLLTDDSFAVSKPVLAAFEARTGIKVAGGQGRRRRRGGEQGDPDQVRSRGRRALRHRQQHPDHGLHGRHLHALPRRPGWRRWTPRTSSTPSTGSPRSTRPTCASTTTRPGSPGHHVAPPTSLDDLTEARYKSLLVTENPATSTPGLAFLLATVAAKGTRGTDDWQTYWKALRANGVEVEDELGHRLLHRLQRRRRARAPGPSSCPTPPIPAYAVINASPRPAIVAHRGDRLHLLPPGRVRRRAGRRPAIRPRPGRWSTSCCRSRSSRTCRCRCTCSR